MSPPTRRAALGILPVSLLIAAAGSLSLALRPWPDARPPAPDPIVAIVGRGPTTTATAGPAELLDASIVSDRGTTLDVSDWELKPR